jgi:RNA polymerase sigma-70 factor (ECF subfamily)
MDESKVEQFEFFYRTDRDRLERVAGRKTGMSDASDVVQNVFARLWEKAKVHVVLTPSYLSRCTSNAAIDQLRLEKRHLSLPDKITPEQYAAPVFTPHQILEARDDIRHLDNIIRTLPERTRHVFLLSRVHGCTYDEIADTLGLSYIMVEREMAKALVACRSGLK